MSSEIATNEMGPSTLEENVGSHPAGRLGNIDFLAADSLFDGPPPTSIPPVVPAFSLPEDPLGAGGSASLSPDDNDEEDGAGGDVIRGPAQIVELPVGGKRPRHKRGAPKARPGRTGWVHGTKEVFFEARKEEWLRESEANRAGAFYTKMAKLYFKKYGYHLADNQDLAVDVADPPDSAANEVVHEKRSKEETEFRAASLKTVRSRIGQWYRTNYNGLLGSDKAAFGELFTGVLDGAPPKPQRGRIEHFYSRKFYETRVKPTVDERLAQMKRVALRTGKPPPEAIDIISKVTAEVWEGETPSFKTECEAAFEREHQIAVRGWEASLADSPVRTAEEAASALANAAYYLQPFVDAIQERFGIVHSGQTKGLAPVNWPTFDWKGFSEVEKSMIAFGRECFSDAECRSRAVAGQGTDAESILNRALAEEAAAGESTSGQGSAGGKHTGGAAGVEATLTSSSTRPETEIESGPVGAGAQNSGGTGGSSSGVSAGGDKDDGSDGANGDGANGDGEKGVGDNGGENESTRNESTKFDHLWQRNDRARWSDELAGAHAAFAAGKGWGEDWGEDDASRCDEKASASRGVAATGAEMAHAADPRGRLGTRDTDELWVGLWWTWWKALQPSAREELATGLSRPEAADWSHMAQMHGRNGLLQVMATLAWWGERVCEKQDGSRMVSVEARSEWEAAVRDVKWVLEQVMESGLAEREDEQDSGRKKKKATDAGKTSKEAGDKGEGGRGGEAGKKRKAASAEGAAEPRRGKKRRVNEVDEGRRTRAKTAAATTTTRSKAAAATTRPKARPLPKRKT
ncbi:hypothetical protein C8R47DRAFT_1220475 [Mycena vitilis]|nr:hypothetical protein C8R47DRAFT_1220475 [Mycena vitilis]